MSGAISNFLFPFYKLHVGRNQIGVASDLRPIELNKRRE